MDLPLDTPRLRLRPFRPADAPAFAAYRSDPRVAEYQGWDAPYPLERAQAFIDAMLASQPGQPGEWYQLAIELRAGGALLGDCAFKLLAHDPRQAEIGMTLAAGAQGQGYALEAGACLLDALFRGYDLHRVQANCDVLNAPSYRLMERLGMRREAHFVENLWFKGRWSSEYWYAILRSEWLARRPGG